MAAKSKSLQVIGKHLVNSLCPCAFPSVVASDLSASRNGHTSAYDKNVEEGLRSTRVPDELTKPDDSEKFWSPHPRTGVFEPSSSSTTTDTTDENGSISQDESVMEEKAWFRPTSLEDLDKTHHS